MACRFSKTASKRFVDGALVWKLHATYGFPLELSVPFLWDRGFMPTWKELIDAAERDGMKTIRDRLSAVFGDAYPPDMAREMRERLARL